MSEFVKKKKNPNKKLSSNKSTSNLSGNLTACIMNELHLNVSWTEQKLTSHVEQLHLDVVQLIETSYQEGLIFICYRSDKLCVSPA